MFESVSSKPDFPGLEEDVLRFWEEEGIFARSLEQRRGGSEFSFYDGPPFATGLPHYGHLLAGTIKDIVPRRPAGYQAGFSTGTTAHACRKLGKGNGRKEWYRREHHRI